jgi:hypothetical protein
MTGVFLAQIIPKTVVLVVKIILKVPCGSVLAVNSPHATFTMSIAIRKRQRKKPTSHKEWVMQIVASIEKKLMLLTVLCRPSTASRNFY